MPHKAKEDTVSKINKVLKALTLRSVTPSESGDERLCLTTQWSNYFQKGTLDDYQRLCGDVGLSTSIPSKTKCRQALRGVNVNIKQFLQSQNKPDDVKFFKSRGALVRYTRETRSFFPLRKLPKGSPLKELLKGMSL